MSCFERTGNVHPRKQFDGPAPHVHSEEDLARKGPPPVMTNNRPNATPPQAWMQHSDSSLCNGRNDAAAGSIISQLNNSSAAGAAMNGFVDSRGDSFRPGAAAAQALDHGFSVSGRDQAHVPHTAPPQPWHASYDSSLHRRRNHDSELSSIMPRKLPGPPSPGAKSRPVTSPTDGSPKKAHSAPMGHQPWAASWDSSLCRGWGEGETADKYSSQVASLIHGGD